MNYLFDPDQCLKQHEIDLITRAHASDPHFGHMLVSLRLSQWALDTNSFVLRDTQARIICCDGTDLERSELQTASDLVSFVRSHFGLAILLKLDAAAPTILKYLAIMNQTEASALTSLLKDYVIKRGLSM